MLPVAGTGVVVCIVVEGPFVIVVRFSVNWPTIVVRFSTEVLGFSLIASGYSPLDVGLAVTLVWLKPWQQKQKVIEFNLIY